VVSIFVQASLGLVAGMLWRINRVHCWLTLDGTIGCSWSAFSMMARQGS